MSGQTKYALAIIAAAASIPLLVIGGLMNSLPLGFAAIGAATWAAFVTVSQARVQQGAARRQQEDHSDQQDHLAAGS